MRMKLIHLLIIGAIGGLVVLGISTRVFTGATGVDHDKAEASARQYAQSLGIKFTGVSCVNTDSDGDGYVSCTIAREGGDPMAVECAGFGMNSGCRMARIIQNR